MKRKFTLPLVLLLLSPLGLVLLCFANPMLIIFLDPVSISNRTTEELRAIPMGRGDTQRVESPPLYWTRFPIALPRARTEFLIPAGETTSFIYDMDDINLCWLLVRSASSNWKVVPSSIHGPSCALTLVVDGGCCRGLDEGFVFEVSDLSGLSAAPEWLVATACPDDDGGC